MPLTVTQIILSLFLVFALSRVILRFKGGEVTLRGLFFWSALFGLAIVAVILPDLTGKVAKTLGIGRGVDAVVYTSIILIFYLVFRLYVYLQDIRHEITDLVQKLALKEDSKKHEKKTTKD